MSYELKQNLANRANYGSKRDLSKIKYLVIHYTSMMEIVMKQMENILHSPLILGIECDHSAYDHGS